MIDRRTLLALAAGSVAGIGPGIAQGTTLRIGYVPVIGASALFVLAGDGSTRDAGFDGAFTATGFGGPGSELSSLDSHVSSLNTRRPSVAGDHRRTATTRVLLFGFRSRERRAVALARHWHSGRRKTARPAHYAHGS